MSAGEVRVLWIDRYLTWALCTDGFWWLYTVEEGDKMRYLVRFELPDDPLGYDTSDPNYLRQMATDSLTGWHQDAVDKEADRLCVLLGRRPIQRTRWKRLKRWISHRYWRARFWVLDRRRGRMRRRR
jgi:hypothetical protein